jgi:mono/diheme cytochrome c family protein
MRLHRLGAGLAVALSAWAALAVAARAEAAATAEQIEQGRIVYEDNCETCHGRNMANPAPAAFDLRTFPRSDAAGSGTRSFTAREPPCRRLKAASAMTKSRSYGPICGAGRKALQFQSPCPAAITAS